MTLLRAQLRSFVAGEMQAAIPAVPVLENRALATYAGALPVIILTAPMERKESRGPGAPKFNAIIHLMAEIKVGGTTDDLLQRWEAIAEQVELAVLANASVVRIVQEFVAVESQVATSVEGGTPTASGHVAFQAVIPQVYDPAMPDQLLEIDVFRDAAMTEPLAKIVPPQ